MRWFKHMTNSFDDEKLSRLVDSCGLEGYGFWWRIVEIVAAHTENGKEPELDYPVSKWCSLIGIHHNKFRKLLVAGAECGLYELFTPDMPSDNQANTQGLPGAYSVATQDLHGTYPPSKSGVSIKYKSSRYRVKICNILKYRDEYTRKSGQNPDKLRTKETDKEIDKEIELNTPPTPPSGGDGGFEKQKSKKSKPEKTSPKKPTGNSIPELRQAIDEYAESEPLRKALNSFRDMRERMRKPMTGDGIRLLFVKLDTLSGGDEATKVAIVEQSVMNSWLGLFPLSIQSGSSLEPTETLFEKNMKTGMAVLAKRQQRRAENEQQTGR